jgi:hypothetical protein
MRVHYVLNHGGTPASKLADVEIHFEEGLLAGLKLVGCSVWRSKRGRADCARPVPLLRHRRGVRYYELLRSSVDGAAGAAGARGEPGGEACRPAVQGLRPRRVPEDRVAARRAARSRRAKRRKRPLHGSYLSGRTLPDGLECPPALASFLP